MSATVNYYTVRAGAGSHRNVPLCPAIKRHATGTYGSETRVSYVPVIFRTFLGTPFRLRDIPRDSVTPGLNGTILYGIYGQRGMCLYGIGIYNTPWRGSGITMICAGSVYAGTGFHIHHTGHWIIPNPEQKPREKTLREKSRRIPW